MAVEDSEDPQVQVEASTASTCDQSNTQVTVCESLCCVDRTEPYQPTNKAVLACMSNNGRHFMDEWFKTYPWLPICVTRKKVFCFHCRNAESKGLLTFSTKAESTYWF